MKSKSARKAAIVLTEAKVQEVLPSGAYGYGPGKRAVLKDRGHTNKEQIRAQARTHTRAMDFDKETKTVPPEKGWSKNCAVTRQLEAKQNQPLSHTTTSQTQKE